MPGVALSRFLMRRYAARRGLHIVNGVGDVAKYLAEAASSIFKTTESDVPWSGTPFTGIPTYSHDANITHFSFCASYIPSQLAFSQDTPSIKAPLLTNTVVMCIWCFTSNQPSHVQLEGSVRLCCAFQLFDATPYKGIMWLLQAALATMRMWRA